LKPASPSLSAAVVALLGAAMFAVTTAAAQTPAPPQQPAGTPPPPGQFHFPAPKNLQVLPKDLTADQVHDTMEKWAGDLGVHCDKCHTPDPNNLAPNGRPRLNFADDSKNEKKVARLMYKMVDNINTNYVSMVENSGAPVTCGTCHRGHFSPEPFVAPPEERRGPGPGGPPPAGAQPPASH
jgi:hypothetical protein